MRIAIQRSGDDIVAVHDYSDIKDSGEIAHILAELETIKQDLLELWQENTNHDKT